MHQNKWVTVINGEFDGIKEVVTHHMDYQPKPCLVFDETAQVL